MSLIENGGESSQEDIAKAILLHDQSQTEYYAKITRDMVGRVLQKRGIVDREGRRYLLRGFKNLSLTKRANLMSLAESKLEEYQEKRGTRIWRHRKQSAG